MKPDVQVTIKAVLLKYVTLDKLEECAAAVMFQLGIVLRKELSENIKTMSREMMIAMLEQEGYTVTKKEDTNVA